MVQGRDKATEAQRDVRYNTLALFFEVQRMKKFSKTPHRAHAVCTGNNVNSVSAEAMQQVIVHFPDHIQEK